MFHRGKVVSEFIGALPSEMIRRWLDTHLPDERGQGLKLILSRAAHPFDASISGELLEFVQNHPEDSLARLRLALSIVPDDPTRARELVDSSPDEPELAEDVASLADLMEPQKDGPEQLVRLLEQAGEAFVRRDLDATLENLIDATMIDKRFDGELSRRAAVAVFRALGQDHELTRQHQRKLAMALHS
jgi:putative thioredoxin